MSNPHFPEALPSTVIDLGAPRRYFPVKPLNRAGSLITFLILVGGSILVCLYGFYVTSLAYQKHGLAMIDDKLLIPLIVSIAMLLAGLAAGWAVYGNWNKGVAIYEHGFAVRDRHGIQAWRWEQVVSLTAALTRHHTIGIYTGTTHVYSLFDRRNQRLVFSDIYASVEDLAKAIQDGIFPILYAQAVEQYNAGQKLVFGPATISKTGIQIGKKTYPWTEVEQVSMHNGTLKVTKIGGGSFSAGRAPASSIPNLNVLLNIIHQVVGLTASCINN